MAGIPTVNLRAILTGTMLAGPTFNITAATWATGNATITTSAPHGATVGQKVIISGVNPVGFNGTYTLGTGTTGSTLVVPIATTPGAYVSGGTAYFPSSAVGTATPNVPIPIGSQAMAEEFFGPGSELAQMFRAFYANNFANEVWGLPLSEPVGAVAAQGKITIVAPPTAAGTLHFYIAGVYCPVNVGSTDTTSQIASAIVSAITNMETPPLPVKAVVNGSIPNEVDLTCNWKGVGGNDIMVSLNFYGGLGGQQTPVGMVLTLPQGTGSPTPLPGFLWGGTGTPSLTTALANLGEMPFEYFACPYNDSQSLFNLDQEYGFTDTGRWGFERALYGMVFSAKRGAYSDLVLWGETENSPVISVMSFENASPSPVYEWAAAYCAKGQRAFVNDPARPLQTLTLNEIKAAPLHQRFNFPELNSLAWNGLAIQEAGSDGQPMIMREQTTYQFNKFGITDIAFGLLTTLSTLATLLRRQKYAITTKYPRHKLANDGTKFGPGQAIVTPAILKGELINQYLTDMYDGLVENLPAFKQYLIVERDDTDPDRVNVLYPPDLINAMRIYACLAQFRLQYSLSIDPQIGAAPPPYQAISGAYSSG